MPDMLVKLYNLEEQIDTIRKLEDKGSYIKRVLAPDKPRVIYYAR